MLHSSRTGLTRSASLVARTSVRTPARTHTHTQTYLTQRTRTLPVSVLRSVRFQSTDVLHAPPKQRSVVKDRDIVDSELQREFNDQDFSQHRVEVRLSNMLEPLVANDTFVAPTATLAGSVQIQPRASVWYDTIIRADVNSIIIGHCSNIQDRCVIREATGRLASDHDGSTIIGSYVTVGHGANLRAVTIEECSLVGMGATLMEGVYMERGSMVAAGAVVYPYQRIKSLELWAGNPARKIKDLPSEFPDDMRKHAERYADTAELHSEEYELANMAYLEAEKEKLNIGWAGETDSAYVQNDVTNKR